jgi:hypothetical protein
VHDRTLFSSPVALSKMEAAGFVLRVLARDNVCPVAQAPVPQLRRRTIRRHWARVANTIFVATRRDSADVASFARRQCEAYWSSGGLHNVLAHVPDRGEADEMHCLFLGQYLLRTSR